MKSKESLLEDKISNMELVMTFLTNIKDEKSFIELYHHGLQIGIFGALAIKYGAIRNAELQSNDHPEQIAMSLNKDVVIDRLKTIFGEKAFSPSGEVIKTMS